MSYAELIEMNHSQLIDAQARAMREMDNETLRKIAKVMTGFRPEIPRKKQVPVTYLKKEVEDIVDTPAPTRDDWRTGFKFWSK